VDYNSGSYCSRGDEGLGWTTIVVHTVVGVMKGWGGPHSVVHTVVGVMKGWGGPH